MSIELRVAHHGMLPGSLVFECWRDGVFVAALYPHEDGIRIVSKYLDDVVKEKEPRYAGGQWVPSAVIKLSEEAKR